MSQCRGGSTIGHHGGRGRTIGRAEACQLGGRGRGRGFPVSNQSDVATLEAEVGDADAQSEEGEEEEEADEDEDLHLGEASGGDAGGRHGGSFPRK